MPLRGKIAAIIDDDSVAINLGSEQGVKPGMKFAAVFETQEITDPDNPDAVLGVLTFEISKLEVKSVLEKLSYCNILRAYSWADMFAVRAQPAGARPARTVVAPSSSGSGPKIDPAAKKLADSAVLVLRVGTVVVEIPPPPPATAKSAPPAPKAK